MLHNNLILFLNIHKSAKELWDQIVKIFETIQDWYNDYEKYHLIGLLAELDNGRTKKVILPCELYKMYHNRCKSEFCAYLRKEIFRDLQETKIFSVKEIDNLKKEDIVLYLRRMKSGISDEEKKRISKEFYEFYVKDHFVMNPNGTVKRFKDFIDEDETKK